MAIKILVDSASDICLEEAKEMGIDLISMNITFDGVDYLDGIELLPEKFYKKLIKSHDLPKTSQVNSYRFSEKLNEMTLKGDSVIIICLSSKLSGTYHSAVLASQKFDGKVHVIDSLSATMGERLLCQYALKLIKEGHDINYIVDQLNEVKMKLRIVAMVDTLEYLKKGGRVSAVTAIAGELLSIKPLISVIDGQVVTIGKAIGSKRAHNLVGNFVNKQGGIDYDMPYGVVWTGLDDTNLNKFISDSKYLINDDNEELQRHIVGSTIGTHVGPGAVGVVFFAKE